MSSVYDWSLTEANNATADSDINWNEGQPPSTVNNSARFMMRRGKELLTDLGGSLSAGGTANALTLTAQSPFTALANGLIVSFRATATNTGAATINVNALGAKAIVKMDHGGEKALVGGEIQNSGMYMLQYSAALASGVGAWLLLSPTIAAESTLGSGAQFFRIGSMLIQFGRFTGTTSGGGGLLVTFATAFADTNFVVSAIFGDDSAIVMNEIVANRSTTTTAFRYRDADGNPILSTLVRGSWIAIGLAP